MTAWSSLAHSLFMWYLRSSRSVMHVLYTLSCSIPTHFSQVDLNPANWDATVDCRGRMNSGVSLLVKTAFLIMSQLRSVAQVLMGHFTIFQSHVLLGWFVPQIMKSCLHLSKLRPKYCRYLFMDRQYFTTAVLSAVQPWILHCSNVSHRETAQLYTTSRRRKATNSYCCPTFA